MKTLEYAAALSAIIGSIWLAQNVPTSAFGWGVFLNQQSSMDRVCMEGKDERDVDSKHRVYAVEYIWNLALVDSLCKRHLVTRNAWFIQAFSKGLRYADFSRTVGELAGGYGQFGNSDFTVILSPENGSHLECGSE